MQPTSQSQAVVAKKTGATSSPLRGGSSAALDDGTDVHDLFPGLQGKLLIDAIVSTYSDPERAGTTTLNLFDPSAQERVLFRRILLALPKRLWFESSRLCWNIETRVVQFDTLHCSCVRAEAPPE